MDTPTQPGIVNAALSELGSTSRIVSIDEGGVARDAKAIWGSCLRTLLASHPWNWAIARVQLNASANTPAFGASNAFTLPPDCLRWLPPAEEDEGERFDVREEGGELLTDQAAPLPIRYISAEKGARIDRWPPYFVRAMELALAERLAEPVAQDESMKRDMAEKAYLALKEAKRRDGLSSNTGNQRRVRFASDWLSARRSPYVGRAPGR